MVLGAKSIYMRTKLGRCWVPASEAVVTLEYPEVARPKHAQITVTTGFGRLELSGKISLDDARRIAELYNIEINPA